MHAPFYVIKAGATMALAVRPALSPLLLLWQQAAPLLYLLLVLPVLCQLPANAATVNVAVAADAETDALPVAAMPGVELQSGLL